jgi:hypothetical protein
MAGHGELAREERQGEGERGCSCGGAMGRGRAAGGAAWGLGLLLCCLLHSVREEELIVRKKRRKERRKRKGRKRKEKKEKNMKIFPNMKIFGEKNKR